MAFDFKAATPDTSIDANAFLFGADSQASTNPSIYQVSTIAALLFASPSVTGAATFPDGSASAPSIAHTGDSNCGLFFPSADTVCVTTAGAERMRITSAGNVGIGVTPSAWSGVTALQIAGSSAVAFSNGFGEINANAYYNGGYKYIGTGYATKYAQSAGVHQWFTAASGSADGAISFSEAMRITSAGNVLIGTTTAGASKLVVNDNSVQINVAKTPASASDTGTTGQVCWDSGYIYVCTASNTWKRAAIATW